MLSRALASIVVFASSAVVGLAADNFTGEPKLVAAAEQCRATAFAYYGFTSPAWSAPCPITWQPGNSSGETSFTFRNGEVSNWRMNLRGTPEQAIDSVLPHEVDHAVRASIVKRPIPRWLDEGMSGQWESDGDQRRLEELAGRFTPTVSDLDSLDYPDDPERLMGLYAWGHRAVQHLLHRGTPQTLIAFMADRRTVPEKLPEYYELTAAEFITCCRQPVVCGPEGCRLVPYPDHLPMVDRRPLLEVWTKANCDPCQRFWNDLDGPQLAILKERFHIHRREFRGATLEAMLKGVTLAPTFLVSGGGRIVGYTSSDDLLQRLGITPAAPFVRESSPVPERPAQPLSDAPLWPTTPAPGSILPTRPETFPQCPSGEEKRTPADREKNTAVPEDVPLDRPSLNSATDDPGRPATQSATVASDDQTSGPAGLWQFLGFTFNTATLLALTLGTGGLGGLAVSPWLLRLLRAGRLGRRVLTRQTATPSRTPVPTSCVPLSQVPVSVDQAEPEQLPEQQIIQYADDRWRRGIVYANRTIAEKYGSTHAPVLREFLSHVQQYVHCRIDINSPA